MRFHAEHQFSAPAAAVVAVLLDPEFHRQLQLPDLSLPEIVEADTDGDQANLRLRYEYLGQLDPIARRLLGDRKLTWMQQLQLHRERGTGRLTFAAETAPDRLNGSADFTVEDATTPAGEPGSVRRLDGDLRVAIRPIGSMAERRIVPGLLRRLDIEAQAVDHRLGAG
ncbi:MAG: DUF2505 family protein [Acidimicrobiales bacterium]